MARLIALALFSVQLLLLFGFAAGDAVHDLWAKGLSALDAQLDKSPTCTRANLQVRKDWGDLTDGEKKAYITAVQCLTSAPSKLNPTNYPGAKTRFDDFVAVHINQTMSIHGTGNFLSWHRYFTWAYEQALRNECGYNGTQPYWNWARWTTDIETSPLFDGSDLSMSGNGEKIAHQGLGVPTGNGGGCVQTGPFKNPMSPAISPAPKANPRRDGFGHNPRCLRRDISNQLSSKYLTAQSIVNLITQSPGVARFQNTMQALNNVHTSGHFTIAGDPAGDFYTSPGDPAFYLHHAMIDRTWAIWQMQDLPNRMQVIAMRTWNIPDETDKRELTGGTSMMGWGSRLQKLEDPVDLDVVADKVYKISDLVSIVDGPFCYYYA
ncbi:Di-copper centre-containing protein [Apiospora hydei]|uniref:Di-copper centre-containing protein n=1 Tax=Apiospora hydei TaxID=1337664 RepID=A0ABR1VXT3_9PEZI